MSAPAVTSSTPTAASIPATQADEGKLHRMLFIVMALVFAIAPFVRQFARHDAARFAQQTAPALSQWLGA